MLGASAAFKRFAGRNASASAMADAPEERGGWNGHGAEIGDGSGADFIIVDYSWFIFKMIFPWCFLNDVLKMDESIILIILKYLRIAPDASIDGAMEKQCQTAVAWAANYQAKNGKAYGPLAPWDGDGCMAGLKSEPGSEPCARWPLMSWWAAHSPAERKKWL